MGRTHIEASPYTLETARAPEKPLGPDTTIIFAGAGPTNVAAALEIVRSLPEDQIPNLVLVDRYDYLNENSSLWEPCKGCASGVPLSTLKDLQQRYDPEGHVLIITEAAVLIQRETDTKILSPNYITELAIHLPYASATAFPTLKLPPDHHIATTFRHRGPSVFWPRTDPQSRQEVGLNETLLLLLLNLLRHRGKQDKFQLITGTIEAVTPGPEPQVTIASGFSSQTISADLVLLGTGTNPGISMLHRSRRPDQPTDVQPQTTQTAIREVPILAADASAIYGADLQLGHLFIPNRSEPVGADIEYAMLTPQRLINFQGEPIVIITVTMLATPGRNLKQAQGKASLNRFIGNDLKDLLPSTSPQADQDRLLACACWPSFPTEALPVEFLHDQGLLIVGDQAGTLRFIKNGIGTGVAMGQHIGSGLVDLGFSSEALEAIAHSSFSQYTPDNRIGKLLLAWANDLVQNPSLTPLIHLSLMAEAHLPYDAQISLRALAGVATGVEPYETIARRLLGQLPSPSLLEHLRQGTLTGKTINALTRLLGHPPPSDLFVNSPTETV